jgi:predicted transport protein
MDAATQSMVDNLRKNTGRSLDEWFTVLEATGLDKHTELMNVLKSEHGVSHGFANSIVLWFRARNTNQDDASLVDAQYAGAKADLRPLYESLVAAVAKFGKDVEIAPKKTSVSLRRSKQFALIEAASAKRLQLGINLKGAPATDRLLEAGGMCTHKVSVTSAEEVDDELLDWLREAYERA